MNSAVNGLNDRIDLEKKFVLWLFALLAIGCAAYAMLEAQRTGLSTIALIGALGVLGSVIAHYMLFKPIRQLVVMANAVGSGDYSGRLGFKRRDEIGALADEMDAMCDQLQAAGEASEAHITALEQLRHSDRVATLGRLASSVAHELGNPLNVIELRAHLITSGDVTTLEEAQHNARVIVEQTRRMTRIIGEILSFARVRPANITRLNLLPVLRQAIALSEHTSKKHRTSIVLDMPKTAIELDGDSDKLLQVFVNLVINGVEAMSGGGIVKVSVSHETRAPVDDPYGEHRDYVCIDVLDHGPGMAEDVVAKVFEPFFSTKIANGGTGLGLSVAQGIAREHEGWISVTSTPGKGSCFRIYLPKQGRKGGDADAS